MPLKEITTSAKLGVDRLGKPTIEFDVDDILKKMDGLEEMGMSVDKVTVNLPVGCMIYGIPIAWGTNATK